MKKAAAQLQIGDLVVDSDGKGVLTVSNIQVLDGLIPQYLVMYEGISKPKRYYSYSMLEVLPKEEPSNSLKAEFVVTELIQRHPSENIWIELSPIYGLNKTDIKQGTIKLTLDASRLNEFLPGQKYTVEFTKVND